MPEENLLPKPQTELPLPEKELPAHAESIEQPPVIDGEVKGNKLKYILIALIAVLVLGGIAYGAYAMGKKSSNPTPTPIANNDPSPTPDPTAEWETYTANGFSFKYPSDWTLIQAPNNISLVLKSPNETFQLFYDIYDLKIQTNKFKCANCSFTTLSTIDPGDGSAAYIIINSNIVNDKEIQIISLSNTDDYSNSTEGWPYLTFPNEPNKVIRWSGQFIDRNNCPIGQGCAQIPMTLARFKDSPEVEIAEQILSTFKFVDTSSSIPANWRSLTNSKYGYTVSYPPTAAYSKTTIPNQSNGYYWDTFSMNGGQLTIGGICGRGTNPIKTSDITIAGTETVKFYETETAGVIKAISNPKIPSEICFEFKLPNSANKDDVDKAFDQILSTLKLN